MIAQLALMTVLMVMATALPMGMAHAQAQNQNRAGVVVQFSDGSMTTRCVAFSEDSITGYDLLRRARVPIAVEFGSFGAAVCKIGNEGCAFPNEPCFCQCQTLGAGCTYWVYSQLRDGAWTISGLGAGARQVRDGDVDGWAWGEGDGNSGIVPVGVTLDQICSAGVVAQVQPTAAATGTALPPTELPATEPSPSLSPALAPSATPEPSLISPSPSAALVVPTPTATNMPATATAAATPAPTPPAAGNSRDPRSDPQNEERDRGQQPATNALGYVFFGVIAAGLLGALALMRRGGGKP